MDTHNSDIAIFLAVNGTTEKDIADAEYQEKRMQKRVDAEQATWVDPFWYVGIRRLVNDTEIPGLQVDWKTVELRCDWKGMLSALFYEAKLWQTLAEKWVLPLLSVLYDKGTHWFRTQD